MATKNTIPSTIKVGYKTITLEGIDAEVAEQLEIHGQIFFDKDKILYNKTLKGLEKFNTILHENIHAIFHYHNTPFENSDHEEKVVTDVANGLTTLLLDNPLFVQYLISVFTSES